MRSSVNRPATIAAVVVAVVVTAVVGFTLSRSRGTQAPPSSASVVTASQRSVPQTYVAMGSSFAAGPGEGPIVDRRCLRTGDNYPHRVAEKLGMQLVDVTCSGSTAAELVTGPKHNRGNLRPQVEAVDENTRLVTLTTGGNDIDFVGRIVAQSCNNMRALGLSNCGSGRPSPPPPSAADYGHLQESLVTAINEIKARGPQAQVIIVDYTPLVALAVPPCQALPLAPWEVAQEAGIAAEMSAINQRVADLTGSQHITTQPLVGQHSACGAQPWVRGYGSKMVFHPNAEGKAGIADLVVNTIRT